MRFPRRVLFFEILVDGEAAMIMTRGSHLGHLEPQKTKPLTKGGTSLPTKMQRLGIGSFGEFWGARSAPRKGRARNV